MPVPRWFDDITHDEIGELVADAVDDWLEENRLFFEGEHWQDGDGWIGPEPSEGEEGRDKTMDILEEGFTPRNVIREIVQRHGDSVVGSEPYWSVQLREDPEEAGEEDEEPPEEDQTLLEEVRQGLRWWWGEREMGEVLKDLVYTALWAERAPLRLFVPRGLLEDGQVPEGSFREQLARIHVEGLDPAVGRTVEDADTRKEIGLLHYEVTTGNPADAGEDTEERSEAVWLEDGEGPEEPGETVVRLLSEDGELADSPFDFDWGGHMPLLELELDLLITEPVRRGQKALNLANSMIPRNITTAGFLERVLLNAQLPGEWVKDEETGQERFQPEPMQWGAGVVNRIVGIETTDEEGNTTYETPQIEYRDPVPVEPAVEAKRSHYQDILEEVDQVHILVAGDATSSGKSREQARGEFERSVEKTKKQVDVLVPQVLMTVMAMAADFATTGEVTDVENVLGKVKANCDCQLTIGPVSPEQQRAHQDQVEADLLSRRTAMARNGIEDVDAELERIEEQESSELALRQEQTEVIRTMVAAGADMVTAARFAGVEEDMAEDLFAEIAESQIRRREQERAFDDRVRDVLRGERGTGGAGADGGEGDGGEGDGE